MVATTLKMRMKVMITETKRTIESRSNSGRKRLKASAVPKTSDGSKKKKGETQEPKIQRTNSANLSVYNANDRLMKKEI